MAERSVRDIMEAIRREPWDILPNYFRRHRAVTNRWGRVGIEFGQWLPVTQPGLLVAILHDGGAHKVEILDQHIGLDLLLTLDVGNTKKRLPLHLLRSLIRHLKDVDPHVAVRAGYECRNRKQDLIIQQPLSHTLARVTGDSAEIDAVYERFQTWLRTLFADGSLEKAIRQVWPSIRTGTAEF